MIRRIPQKQAGTASEEGVCSLKHREGGSENGDGSKRKGRCSVRMGGGSLLFVVCTFFITLIFCGVLKFNDRFELESVLRGTAGDQGESQSAIATIATTQVAAPVSRLIFSDLTTSSKLVETQHDQLHTSKATGSGSKHPVLLTAGWKAPDLTNEQEFLKEYGDFPVYIKDSYVQIRSEDCVLPYKKLWEMIDDSKEILAFTNNKENPTMFEHLKFETPEVVSHIDSFSILSAMQTGQSHSFHRHGESWFGLSAGLKVWWFLPPSVKQPERVNACDYLNGKAPTPEDATTMVQTPGTIVWFPKDWYHATCALDPWTIGVGSQVGPLIRQQFKPLPATTEHVVSDQQAAKLWSTCAANQDDKDDQWKWFDGDLTEYYNQLEEDHKRNPNDPAKYAVHRWLGPTRSTLVHYDLIHDAILRHIDDQQKHLSVLDAGCGLGSGLMWMEQQEPTWKLHGRTLSDGQVKFIEEKLPKHNFDVALKNFNDLTDSYDAIYSIEAVVHSPNIEETVKAWGDHLTDNGAIVVIDDFIAPGFDRSDHDIDMFNRGWMINLMTTMELHDVARKFGLELVEARDLTAEYRIAELNYKNSVPNLSPDNEKKNHQGWMGAKYRHKATVEGKIEYDMLVFRKSGQSKSNKECAVVPSITPEESEFQDIVPKKECLSGWYCCGKGPEWFADMDSRRTDKLGFLKLDPNLFGNYMETFAKHLNNFYKTLPADHTGRFLDIGGTGSTSSGMKQVTTKFQHFAGPLEYWMLDSDVGAKALPRTVYCDICACPEADTCGFDVTFSHTVLEHASRPEQAFDTVARITKKGGLTMHLVPWSYQYHATPDDFYRFSHTALKVIMEDRGFEVLEIGYDICSKPEKKLKSVDEHYDTIWLTYVVAIKK